LGTEPIRRVPAYYWAAVTQFLSTDVDSLFGILARSHDFDLESQQKQAWDESIHILKTALAGLDGTLYLEFDIPRLGSRIDAVVVSGPAVFPIEFKCGEDAFHLADRDQVWDYALDLKNFHLASHSAALFPILVATKASTADGDATWGQQHEDGVRPPRRCNGADLGRVLKEALEVATGDPLNAEKWGMAPYRPTPTIIEAARALYSRHSVEAISRNDAGAKNLSVTSTAVEEIIDAARAKSQKAIVFVTGVPGAGKTLVGLNIATQRRQLGHARAVFLSGNGPLVSVLREALIRDELSRRKGVRRGIVRDEVIPFIQNIHHFRDDGLRDTAAPDEHVVIFDEAQRAWNKEKTADFMKRRKGKDGFDQSEADFLISYLDRHTDWAVIICLVGGGQEINTGEAGISAWLDALTSNYLDWQVYISPDLRDSEYAADKTLRRFERDQRTTSDPRLHLSVSMRSFRSEKVSAFVKALLDCESKTARELLAEVSKRYSMAITRDLAQAKQWIRQRARGSERYGLVASSEAQRLKPHAIDVRVDVDPIQWFLGHRHDTRSSYYLEDAATEFQIQGLELDWICVTWDADLRLQGHAWRYHSFRGDAWTKIHKEERKRYLLNAYRVLLTRARQGMVIFVPTGDDADPTRDPSFYDETFAYLAGLGLRQI